MAPTQATRLDRLEEDLAALQTELPELKESMIEKITGMKKTLEETQTRAFDEQNQRLDECVKGQKDLTVVITILMEEVKKLNAKSSNREEESPQNQSSNNRERSEIDKTRHQEMEHSQLISGLRQSLEKSSGKRHGEVRKLDFLVFFAEDGDGWVSKVEHCFGCI